MTTSNVPDSIPPEDQSDAQAAQQLQRVAENKMRAHRARLVTEFMALALLTLLIPALLDYQQFWPIRIRYLAMLGWGLLMAGFLAWTLREWRRLESAKTVALDLERQRPEIRCDVSTASEYASRPEPSPAPLDAELISALQQRAEFHLQGIEALSLKSSTNWRTISCVVAGLLLLLLAAFPGWRTALLRILLPGAVPHYTDVTVQPGKSDIPMKSDLEVSAEFKGRLPAPGLIAWQQEDGSWKTASMTLTGGKTFTYQFKDVRKEFSYRVAGNDALSPIYAVTVYPTPEIATCHVDVVPPAYAQLPNQQSASGNAAALRGSELRWKLVATRPLTKAHFHFTKGGPDLDLQPTSDGAWTCVMTLKADGNYLAQLLDNTNHANLNPDTFHLVAIPDAPPQVDISSPEVQIIAEPDGKIPIAVAACDDIGLSSVNLLYQRPGQPTTPVPLLPKGKSVRKISCTQILDLTPLHLKPYDVLVYYAEARDNNTYDGPGVAKSHAHFLVISDPAQPKPHGSPPGGDGQQFDLMAAQRDMISATNLLADTAPLAAMKDLASAQRQTKGYAEKLNYRLHHACSPPPPEALTAMDAVVDDMGLAATALDAGDRPNGLTQESLALADLFQVVRYLRDGDPAKCTGAGLALVLEKVKRDVIIQNKSTQEQLAKALAQTRELQKAQQFLMQKCSSPGKGQSNGKEKNPESKGSGSGDGKSDDALAGGKKPSPGEEPKDVKTEVAAMTKEQQALADQARELAHFLEKVAGENPGVSHELGQSAIQVGGQMDNAAHELQRGPANNLSGVSMAQLNSIKSLTAIGNVLENALAVLSHQSDVEEETAPPEYADQLARYFQKLSHEK